jgi:hypothetical protein
MMTNDTMYVVTNAICSWIASDHEATKEVCPLFSRFVTASMKNSSLSFSKTIPDLWQAEPQLRIQVCIVVPGQPIAGAQ